MSPVQLITHRSFVTWVKSSCFAEMVAAAHQALADFVKNKEAAAVLIDSTSDKAFCAGSPC